MVPALTISANTIIPPKLAFAMIIPIRNRIMMFVAPITDIVHQGT